MIEWTGKESDERKQFQKGSQEIGIFELSNLFGITTEALRKYEAKKILQPYRGENKYRKYSSWELTKLIRVRQLRQAGLSLDDIADELKIEDIGRQDQSMEQLRNELMEEIAYREKVIRWIDEQRNEMREMEKYASKCGVERKERQYCCVYMVDNTLVDKTGVDRERLKEWIGALPFARVYYIKGLQEDTLSCLALGEDEIERYSLQHLVPDFILPKQDYVVRNVTHEHQIDTEITLEKEAMARKMAEQMGFALQSWFIMQMVWYTHRERLFLSHNKVMFPIDRAEENNSR